MAWGRCDDGWWRHEKVLRLKDTVRLAAGGLYWSAISWSNDTLADGRVPLSAVRILSGTRALADELVRVGLWEGSARAGYAIHDYMDFNRSRAQIQVARKKWADDKARGRSKSTTDSTLDMYADSTLDSDVDSTTDTPADSNVDSTTDSTLDSLRDSPPRARSRARSGAPTSATARGPFSRSPVSRTESLLEENRSPTPSRSAKPERADVAALLARGWRGVSQGQRKVLDEVLDRHDVTGPAWAASIIDESPPDVDPLQAVILADRAWQNEQRDRAGREDAAWRSAKADDRNGAVETLGELEAFLR